MKLVKSDNLNAILSIFFPALSYFYISHFSSHPVKQVYSGITVLSDCSLSWQSSWILKKSRLTVMRCDWKMFACNSVHWLIGVVRETWKSTLLVGTLHLHWTIELMIWSVNIVMEACWRNGNHSTRSNFVVRWSYEVSNRILEIRRNKMFELFFWLLFGKLFRKLSFIFLLLF